MARTSIAVQSFTGAAAGASPTAPVAGDVANGNVITKYSPTTMLRVVNSSGVTPYSVTIATPNTVRGRAIADDVTQLAANAEKWFGPFDPALYGEDLQVNVENASLTVSAFQVVVS